MAEEYTVELYKSLTDEEKRHWKYMWQKQAYVGDSYEDCEDFIEKNPVEDPYYYSIWCIEYDSKGNEIESYPVH